MRTSWWTEARRALGKVSAAITSRCTGLRTPWILPHSLSSSAPLHKRKTFINHQPQISLKWIVCNRNKLFPPKQTVNWIIWTEYLQTRSNFSLASILPYKYPKIWHSLKLKQALEEQTPIKASSRSYWPQEKFLLINYSTTHPPNLSLVRLSSL